MFTDVIKLASSKRTIEKLANRTNTSKSSSSLRCLYDGNWHFPQRYFLQGGPGDHRTRTSHCHGDPRDQGARDHRQRYVRIHWIQQHGQVIGRAHRPQPHLPAAHWRCHLCLRGLFPRGKGLVPKRWPSLFLRKGSAETECLFQKRWGKIYCLVSMWSIIDDKEVGRKNV